MYKIIYENYDFLKELSASTKEEAEKLAGIKLTPKYEVEPQKWVGYGGDPWGYSSLVSKVTVTIE